MTLLARTLARVVGFLLLVLLALIGLAAAMFAIQGGDATLSYPRLAELVRLPELRDEVGSLYGRLEAGGPVAIVSLLAGLGAMLVGVLLVIGAVVPRRERDATLDQSAEGDLSARRRALGQAAEALAKRADGVVSARARVRPGRGRNGRLRVRADLTRPTAHGDAREAITGRVAPLADAFHLRPKITTRAGGGGSRVQ